MSAAASPVAALALVYGVVVALAPLVQLQRVLKRRSSADLSLTWMTLYAGGCLVWLLYGVSIDSLPLIVSQAANFGSISATLVVARRFRTKSTGPGRPDYGGPHARPRSPTPSRRGSAR